MLMADGEVSVFGDGIAYFNEAAALLDAARESVDDQAVLAEVMATRAHVAILAGDYGRAYADAEAALRIADPAGLVAVIANAEMTKAQTLFDQQRLTEAVALCSLALQLGLEADLSDQALRGYNNLAYLRVEGGQPAKALELIDAGLALARERGDRTWERDLIAQRVALRTYRGEWDRALSEGDALREQGEDVAERAAWQTRPIILAARGEVRALEEWLARDLPDSESHEQAVDDAIARATALSAVGRKAEAATLARGAWTEVQATGRAASDVAIYFAQMVDVARTAERGKFDLLFLADSAAVSVLGVMVPMAPTTVPIL